MGADVFACLLGDLDFFFLSRVLEGGVGVAGRVALKFEVPRGGVVGVWAGASPRSSPSSVANPVDRDATCAASSISLELRCQRCVFRRTAGEHVLPRLSHGLVPV